jgi:mycoredoxin
MKLNKSIKIIIEKTQYYKTFLKTRNLDYVFLDVEQYKENASELLNLYENRKLNFPTITINDKKLRNPSDKDLLKWIGKAHNEH